MQLHAGCGSGQVDVDLHDSFRVTRVDISTEALSIYSRENPHAHALRHADILARPFADESFDGTYNLGVVEHFEGAELDQLFREPARVTKTGGRVVGFWPHRSARTIWLGVRPVRRESEVVEPTHREESSPRKGARVLVSVGGLPTPSGSGASATRSRIR